MRRGQREKRKTVHREMSGELSRRHGQEWDDRKKGSKKDTLFFAREKIRIHRGRIGSGESNELVDLLDILGLNLTAFGLIVFGHQSDDKRVLELVIIKDGTILKFMDFVRAEETWLVGRGSGRRSEATNSLFKIVIGGDHIDDGIHIGVVRVISGEQLIDVTLVGGFGGSALTITRVGGTIPITRSR
jgi:hypothetical protein